MTKETKVKRHDIAVDQGSNSDRQRGPNCIFTVRLPRDWSAFEQRIIAVERSPEADDSELSPDTLGNACRAYWSDTVGYVSSWDEDLVSKGAQILAELNIEPPRETLKRILGLAEIDEETANDVNTALFTVFNTATHGVNMDDVALGIATFMRCQASSYEGADIEFAEPPFGDDTSWKLLTIPHA